MESKDQACVWWMEKLDWADYRVWHTDCGEEQIVSPKRYSYCPFCGRRINVLRPKESEK